MNKNKSLRHNAGKLRWALVDFQSLENLVAVLEFGATKYAPLNWKKGLHREEILESMQRHLICLFAGQETDHERGLSHIGHILCNAMFYNYHFKHGSFSSHRNNPFTKSQSKKWLNTPN